MEWCAVRSFVSDRGFVLLLSPLGQRRHIPGVERIGRAVITPYSGEVLGIECVPFNLKVFKRLSSIVVVLTARAIPPARRRRNRRQGRASSRVLILRGRGREENQHQRQRCSDRQDSISHGFHPYFLWMMPAAGSRTFSLKKFSSMGAHNSSRISPDWRC